VKLLAATRSAGKQKEIRRLVEAAGHEVVFPDDAGLPERAEEDLLETEPSFEANARRKAEYFARLSGLPTFADDSGLEVFSLGGAPGVRSKRFAGGGRILEAPMGGGGFGYDPYFLCTELGKSFGEASPEDKDAVSHRGRALRALLAALARS
jgi:XTP/dITP diphosphohydrolase